MCQTRVIGVPHVQRASLPRYSRLPCTYIACLSSIDSIDTPLFTLHPLSANMVLHRDYANRDTESRGFKRNNKSPQSHNNSNGHLFLLDRSFWGSNIARARQTRQGRVSPSSRRHEKVLPGGYGSLSQYLYQNLGQSLLSPTGFLELSLTHSTNPVSSDCAYRAAPTMVSSFVPCHRICPAVFQSIY
jgi:hypothetical protein